MTNNERRFLVMLAHPVTRQASVDRLLEAAIWTRLHDTMRLGIQEYLVAHELDPIHRRALMLCVAVLARYKSTSKRLAFGLHHYSALVYRLQDHLSTSPRRREQQFGATVGQLLLLLAPEIARLVGRRGIEVRLRLPRSQRIAVCGTAELLHPKKVVCGTLRVSEEAAILKGPEGARLVDIGIRKATVRSWSRAFFRHEKRSYTRVTGVEWMPRDLCPELKAPADEGASSIPDLQNVVTAAWQEMSERWPAAGRDLRTFCKAICVGSARQSASSGSSAYMLCAQSLSLPVGISRQVVMELLIHEASHSKLAIAELLMPLLNDDGVCRHTHAFREGLRPLRGVMYAAHAFVAVMDLYARTVGRSSEFFEEIQAGVENALATVEGSGRLTPAGRIFVREMRSNYIVLARGGRRGPHAVLPRE